MKVPPGGSVTVDQDVEHAEPESSPKRDPLPSLTTTPPTPGTWELGPEENKLPGPIHRPAELPGVGRWQVETVSSRVPMDSVAWSHDGRWLACAGEPEAHVRLYAFEEGRLRLARGHSDEFRPSLARLESHKELAGNRCHLWQTPPNTSSRGTWTKTGPWRWSRATVNYSVDGVPTAAG